MDNFEEKKTWKRFCGFGCWAVLKWHFSTAQQPKVSASLFCSTNFTLEDHNY